MEGSALDSLVVQIMAKAYGPSSTPKDIQDLVARLPTAIQVEREELGKRAPKIVPIPAASTVAFNSEGLKAELQLTKDRILSLQATISSQDALFHEWKTNNSVSNDTGRILTEGMHDGLRAGFQFHTLRSCYGTVRRKINSLHGGAHRDRSILEPQSGESRRALKATSDDIHRRIVAADAKLRDTTRDAQTSALVVKEIKDLTSTYDRLNRDYQRVVGHIDGSMIQNLRPRSLHQPSSMPVSKTMPPPLVGLQAPRPTLNGSTSFQGSWGLSSAAFKAISAPPREAPMAPSSKTVQPPSDNVKHLAQPLVNLGSRAATDGVRAVGRVAPATTLGFQNATANSPKVIGTAAAARPGPVSGAFPLTGASGAHVKKELGSPQKRPACEGLNSSIDKKVKIENGNEVAVVKYEPAPKQTIGYEHRVSGCLNCRKANMPCDMQKPCAACESSAKTCMFSCQSGIFCHDSHCEHLHSGRVDVYVEAKKECDGSNSC